MNSNEVWVPPNSIWTCSPEMLGPPPSGLSAGGLTWFQANLIHHIPFRIPAPIVLRRFLYFGSSGSGNVEMGVYDEGLNKLFSTGTVAFGTGAQAPGSPTNQSIPAGRYLLAIQFSSTPTLNAVNYSVATARMLGSMLATPGSFGLPATAAPGQQGITQIPIIGFEVRRFT